MSAAEQIELGLIIRGLYGSYRLEEYLGGGQTAWVYGAVVLDSSVADRIGQRAAVKLMMPGLDHTTQKRFQSEEQTLIELRHQLDAFGLNQGKDGLRMELTPTVWDTVTAEPAQALVMSRAKGVPVDQLLRGQSSALPEPTVLQLMRQVAATFVALHEGLQRSYLDFQPRNIFWDAEKQQAMVIDWNLLASGSNVDYIADVRQLAYLTCRLLTGVTPRNETRLGLTDTEPWQTLSAGMKTLLLDVLSPTPPPGVNTSRAFWTELNAHHQRWQQNGDDLLVEAAASAADLPEDDADSTTIRSRYDQAWTLYDMAMRRGISSYMEVVRQSLAERFAVTEKNLSHNKRGRIFLAAGDLSAARMEFTAGVETANDVVGQLQAWRWLNCLNMATANEECFRVAADAIAERLDDIAAIDYWHSANWQALADRLPQMGESDWGGIAQEIVAYASIQESLSQCHVLTSVTDPVNVTDWTQKLTQAMMMLDELPGKHNDLRYSTAAWMFIGQGSAAVGRQLVQTTIATLDERHRVLTQIHAQLEQVTTPDMLLARMEEYPGEPLLMQAGLERSQEWIDDAGYDGAVTNIANKVLATSTDTSLRRQAEEVLVMFVALREVSALTELFVQLCGPAAEANGTAALVETQNTISAIFETEEGKTDDEEILLDPLHRLAIYLLARIRWLYAHYDEARSVPTRLHGQLEKLARHAISTQQVVYLMQDALETLAPTLAERLKHELNQAKRDQQIEHNLHKLQQERQALTLQVQRLSQQKDKLNSAVSVLKTEQEEASATLLTSQDQQNTAAAKVQRLQGEKNELEENVTKLTATLDGLERKERTLRQQIAQLESDAAQKEKQSAQLQAEIEQWHNRQKKLRSQVEKQQGTFQHPIRSNHYTNRTFSRVGGSLGKNSERVNQPSQSSSQDIGDDQTGRTTLEACREQHKIFMRANRKYAEYINRKMDGVGAVEESINALFDAEYAYRITEGLYESLKEWKIEDEFCEAWEEMKQKRSANLSNAWLKLAIKP
ncbi:hypothetical protein KC887_01695 [Candidatus Kaiserbacteria bacterium]|nr:hypothetical protein [Candidatus Kaiserbacteria bacterium]